MNDKEKIRKGYRTKPRHIFNGYVKDVKQNNICDASNSNETISEYLVCRNQFREVCYDECK